MESEDRLAASLREATAADREAIRRLVNDAFSLERALKKGGVDRLHNLEELDALMATGRFLLLEESGAPAACVYVRIRNDRCYMGLLSITPSRQGAGLGRQMSMAAEAFARERGCRWMDLSVVSPRRNNLVPIYERLGYRETGSEAYPEPLAAIMIEPGHFILMSKEL